MAEKLYLPSELSPTRFLRANEGCLTGHQLCAQASELHAVTGEEQFQFLWESKDKIPEDWKEFWGLLVPDPAAGVVRVLIWDDVYSRWCRDEDVLYSDFDDYRILVPCELSS